MKRKMIYGILAGASLIVLAVFAVDINSPNEMGVTGTRALFVGLEGSQATVYRSISCGCCGGYAGGLKGKGANVKTINLEDTSSIKSKYGIPTTMESCHTTVIGDYFVEGHVPYEAVSKLLTEKPDIKGIALPGMPSGSPGMPGAKRGDWDIYAIGNDGEVSVFMRL